MRSKRPKLLTPHPVMSPEEIRKGTDEVWENFYSVWASWKRSNVVKSLRSRLMFVLASKAMLYGFGKTGLSTDSARASRASQWAGLGFSLLQKLMTTKPMPDLQVPTS